MTFRNAITAAVAAAVIASMPGTASANDHCKRVSAGAAALTKDIATVLAKEAVYQTITLGGMKTKGAADVSCKYVGILTDCTATQAACK